MIFKPLREARQKESGRRPFLLGMGALLVPGSTWGQPAELDAGGATFREFGVADNGSSFNRIDPMIGSGANPTQSRVLAIDKANGLARIRFESIRIEIALPLGWQAQEDWERGVGLSADRRYRVILWRVDFAFEGVADAEHYAATKSGTIPTRKKGVQAQARKLADGTYLVGYQNVPASTGDGGPRSVYDLVVPRPGVAAEGVLLTLGMPAKDADRGLKLLALLKSNLRIDW